MAPGFWLLAGSEPGCSFSLSCELCNKTRRVTRSNWIQIISSVARWSVRRGLDSCSKSYNIFQAGVFNLQNWVLMLWYFAAPHVWGQFARAAWSPLAVTRCLRITCCSLWPAAAAYCRCPYLARLFAPAPHVRIVCAEFSAQFMQMFPFLEDAPVTVSDLQSAGDWRYSICVQIISQESGMSNIFTCPQIF